MPDQATPLTAAEVAEWAAEHAKVVTYVNDDGVPVAWDCAWCGDEVPCTTARLLATLAARDAEVTRLRGLLQQWYDCGVEYSNRVCSGGNEQPRRRMALAAAKRRLEAAEEALRGEVASWEEEAP